MSSRSAAPSDASLVAPGVDTAPSDAIVRIAAQSVRLVNVIGVAVRIARIPEYPRHLTRGELVRLLHSHDGNVSAFSLATRDSPDYCRAKRNPQRDRLFHWRLLCAWRNPPQLYTLRAL